LIGGIVGGLAALLLIIALICVLLHVKRHRRRHPKEIPIDHAAVEVSSRRSNVHASEYHSMPTLMPANYGGIDDVEPSGMYSGADFLPQQQQTQESHYASAALAFGNNVETTEIQYDAFVV
jgi:hypothetical protein